MSAESIDTTILIPAFAAGLLILATHVPLGIQVLSRGIVFIDLAIAQIASLGVIAADSAGFRAEGPIAQGAAVTAALLGAVLLTWTEKHWPEIQEALIGVLFVLAAAAGMLLVAHHPHGGEHLQELLSGQILWVSPGQLVSIGLLNAGILLLHRWRGERLGRLGFYGLFAFAVTASVQLVGVYLVFASLIIPALASQHVPQRHRLAIAYALGALAYALGLALSAGADLPPGPLIVWTLALVGTAANRLFARTHRP